MAANAGALEPEPGALQDPTATNGDATWPAAGAGELHSPDMAMLANPAPRGLLAWLGRLFGRRLGRAEEGELAAVERERESLRRHRTILEQEAALYAGLIPDKLADLNICYRYKRREADNGERVKLVAIRRPYILRDEAIYLHVDLRPGRAPRGVGIDELADPKTLNNLSVACGHKVLCKYAPERGFWYIIEREVGIRGIPSHVKYDDILAGRPASVDGLVLPFGVGENKRAIWRSLALMQSLLVAGTTGGGKSNILSVWICTLLRYNSKRRLRLLLVDLKGGVEFSFFADVPHLLPIALPGERTAAIIENRADVVPAFEWLVTEGERRLGLLKAERAKHIGEYNYHNRTAGSTMAHIVVVIDEWADVKLEPKLGKQAEELLINIASRFRACGIHIILCTQTPNKDVVSIRVKNVLPARLALSCPSIHASMLIVGNGRAAGLEPAGRAIFDWGPTQLEIQTPLITNKAVDDLVAQVVRGKFDDIAPAAHDVTDQEIFEWALADNGGNLDYRGVWNKYRLRGLTQEFAKSFCKQAEGATVVVGASAYKVMPGNRKMPRRLLPLAEVPEDEQPGATIAGAGGA